MINRNPHNAVIYAFTLCKLRPIMQLLRLGCLQLCSIELAPGWGRGALDCLLQVMVIG